MGFLNLVPVIRWHIRYVVAWRQSNTLESGLCAKALVEALAGASLRCSTPSRGATSPAWSSPRSSREHVVKISVGGKGRYQGNIFEERLWRTVKCEEV